MGIITMPYTLNYHLDTTPPDFFGRSVYVRIDYTIKIDKQKKSFPEQGKRLLSQCELSV